MGGHMLEAALNMRRRGWIVEAGMISQYDLEEPQGIKNLVSIIYKQVKIEAFILWLLSSLSKLLGGHFGLYIREGKITYVEDTHE